MKMETFKENHLSEQYLLIIKLLNQQNTQNNHKEYLTLKAITIMKQHIIFLLTVKLQKQLK